MVEYTSNGMKYIWELINCNGSGYTLFPDPHHTKQQIKAAKKELRSKFDIVWLRTASAYDRDNLYLAEILREPEVKQLRWNQINTDEEVIRRERLKGTSPKEYVQTYILPFVKDNETDFLNWYGNNT